MSAKENLGDYYADTAYTPTKRQQWEEANPERDTIIGSRLSWSRRTQDNGTNEEYGHNNIAISQNWEDQRIEKSLEGDDIFKGMKVRYDHQVIMPPHHTALTRVLHVATAFGIVFFFMSTASFFLLFLIISFHWLFGGNNVDYFLSSMLVSAQFFVPVVMTSLVLWKGGRYLEGKHPSIFYGMRKAPLWRLNRQTGLLTIYDPKTAWEKRLEAPFWEYDAFLQSSPDTQGSATYSLILYHPFQQIRQKLDAQFPPTNMPGELVAAWQFIQRYMDVSQPLPDVPALEIHRHKDPTTAAADQRKGRNPRYWRDMSEAEVEKIQKEKYQKNIRLR
ncbi:hypothetical protein QEN58_13675 [Halomonas alkaliantarctica]|uniref:Uncharacterized protein n=1 Tax=Halomonas alkaliantarctica TaxID=232346 RepID=A0ABY8LIV5_9GAMM|nr:hypothetical protein [Halomonas alkaliantarctica]WGI24373.1 hypothetical protein QEN58_13675 [Halomonas alkaliantarctica]